MLENGEDGWSYTREYYYHDGALIFAFIYNFDGTEQHRLYFKDGHMIRYIDENHTVYDFGALAPFEDWEKRTREEAARLYCPDAVDPAVWLGAWFADNGEWIRVTWADEEGLAFTYHHMTELGMADSFYDLPFLNAEKTAVAEDDGLIDSGGWRYSFTLEGDHIRVTSRYPDNLFYK